MPTVASWTTELVLRPVADLVHLLRFRATSLRHGSRRARWMGLVFLVLTAAAAVVPAYLSGAGSGDDRAFDILLLLPTAFGGLLLIAAISAVASGGGRELLSREEAAIHPVSATTDHLGALLLAPLNIAWLIQAWTLLGAMAYALGPRSLAAAQIGVLVWLATATALGQVVAWTAEAVRRGPYGLLVVRTAAALAGAGAVALQVTGHLAQVLDRLPTRWIVVGLLDGFSVRWWQTIGVEVLLLVVAVAVGAVPAHLAARRVPRDEMRSDGGTHSPRRDSSSVLGMLVRVDRGSVWRAVPMRRGLAVLAIGPGAVALAGGLDWGELTILPGLVASGGALLFGVNAWCLDGRGALWRETLPVGPGVVFAARTVVLAEFLLVASGITLALAVLRAGVPTLAELTALLCTWIVVVLQVVSGAMRWSGRSPYAVDLRSARATPAPPLAMVGYSGRLAVATTLTSLVFSGLARLPVWEVSVLVAAPFVLWSAVRLLHARDRWVDPFPRARVVTAVAG